MKYSINKKAFLLVSIFFIGYITYGQKTETNLNFYTGLFSFRGHGSASSSWINFNPYTSPQKYTSNAYGKKGSFSYAFELQTQRITKKKSLYGLGISFETLTSKVNIDTLTQNGFVYYQFPGTGKTRLKNTFITLNPYVGHRYITGKLSIDLFAGFDLGFCLRSHELGEATTNDNKYSITVDNNKDKPSIDVRPRVQIKTQYKKTGLLLGYSFGLINYQIKGNPKSYATFLRIGICYAIK